MSTPKRPSARKPSAGKPWEAVAAPGLYRYRFCGGWHTVRVTEAPGGERYQWHFTEMLDNSGPHGDADASARFYGPLRQDWIPVAWGCPDDEEHVLCCNAEGDDISTGFKDGENWFHDYCAEPKAVKYWQPLPGSPV